MTLPDLRCMCGALDCRSCGPAQGCHVCPSCGAINGDCEDPADCVAACHAMAAALAAHFDWQRDNAAEIARAIRDR